MSETVKLTIDVERDGWTEGMQLSINDATGGFRLKGPKFNGSSKPMLSYTIDQRGADAIRRYLDKHFPATGGTGDLLEALKALVEDLSHFTDVSESIFHSLNLADAAIAKAERRSNA